MEEDPEHIDKIANVIKTYLNKNNYNSSVVEYYTPTELKNIIDCTLHDAPGGIDKVFELVDQYLKYCVRSSHPQFFNQLWSGFNMSGFIGEILTSLTNTSMYTYEVAPVATLIEINIIDKLLKLIGFSEEGGGTFVTGGSNGNLVAMLLARNKVLASGKDLGDLCVFYSEKSHYCMDTAAMVLGINKINIIKIPCNEHHEMDTSYLNQKIKQIVGNNKVPFFVGATAGTTIAGAFDSIVDIANITDLYDDCWLHVDGAHGASALFSNKHKELLNGCHLADSIVWDAHKIIGMTLICSALLVKDKKYLNFHNNNVDAMDYLFNSQVEHSTFNLGTNSLQCGRRADCIKLWLTWSQYGTAGLAMIVENLMDLASYAEEIVKNNSLFIPAIKREFVNICFYYNIEDQSINHNEFHAKIKQKLYNDGTTMVNTASINNKLCIRLVISNHKLSKNDIDIFFSNILNAASYLLLEHSK